VLAVVLNFRPSPMNLRFFQITLALVCAGPGVMPAQPPTPEQLTQLFLPPELNTPQLSPTGEYLGMQVRRGDHFQLGLLTLATGQLEIEGGPERTHVMSFWWKGPRRVILGLLSETTTVLGQKTARVPSLVGIDIDGKDVVDLWRTQQAGGTIVDGLPDDPRHVLKATDTELLQVDISTGNIKRLEIETGSHLLRDGGNHFRAGADVLDDGSSMIKWKPPGNTGAAWHEVIFKAGERRYRPIGFDQDPRYLWVWDETQGDEVVVSRLDTVTGTRQVTVRRPGIDPTRALFAGRPRLPVAVAYGQDIGSAIEPLGSRFADAIRQINACYQGFAPQIVDCQPERNLWVIRVGTSRLPGAFFVFNSRTAQSTPVGLMQSQLTEDRLVAPEQINVKGRTGAMLRGLLWRPVGVKLPALILRCPSRLPDRPATDTFDPKTQALVALGFAVAVVDVRGTYGYGQAIRATADGNVTDTVREDFEDVVRALAGDQIVDRSRVALYGVGLGGALALKLAVLSDDFAAAVSCRAPDRLSRHDLVSYSDETSMLRTFDELGGWSRSGKLADELSPINVAPALKKPALHLQDTDFDLPDKLNDDGRRLKKAVEQAGVPARVGIASRASLYYRPPSDVARDEAMQMLQIADFLNEVLAKR